MKTASSIAIVGIGGIFPHAPDPSFLWDIVHSATNTAEEPPPGRWVLPLEEAYAPEKGLPDRVYSRRACFVDHASVNLDYSRLNIDASLVKQLDPVFQLLLHAGTQAFFDTAVVPEKPERIGVIAGNLALPTETSARLAQDYLGRTLCEQVLGHYVAPSETAALNRFVTGMPAAVLAHALGLGGTCFTLDAACASSLYALKLAVEELRSGRADVMLAGGVARPDSLYTQMGFSQLRALSPSGTCSPFDRNGDGLVVGEGAGMVVLKRTADAVRAGDHIYATIEGIGLSNDIGGSLLAPTSEGQLRAMRAAYAQAEWKPSDVELIECHATGTPVGDAVEVESLCQLWDESPQGGTSTPEAACVLGSVKSNIGHLLTAAGSAALIKTLLAMKHKTLPPTANHTTALERLNGNDVPFRVLSEAQAWECGNSSGLRRAGVSAFGFGGINAHVLLQEWDKDKCAHAYSNDEAGNTPEVNPKACDEHSSSRNCEDIAIVGLDVRTGAADSTAAFRSQVLGQNLNTQLRQPEHWGGAQQSNWWDTEGFNACYGAYIREVSLPAGKFRIPPTEMRDMLPRQALMLLCAEGALEDAGVSATDHATSGVFIGTGLDFNATSFSLRWRLPSLFRQWQNEGVENLPPLEKLQDMLSEPLNANRTMGALGSVVASRIARAFGVGGPSFTLASEENSGMHAVECACSALQRREIDLAIAGGVDMPGDIRTQLSNQRLGFQAPVADAACALILKRVEDAQADGDRIYAVIASHASTTGAQHNLLNTAADTRTRALEQLCHDSQGGKTEYAFIETCTLTDTDSHTESIHSIPAQVQIGHAGEAGSMLALAKTVLALQHKIIPPRQQHGKEIIADYWIDDAARGPRRALVEGYAAGGSVCLFEVREAEGRESSEISPMPERFPLACPDDDTNSATLICVYGSDSGGISAGLQRLKDEMLNEPDLPLPLLARRWDNLNPKDEKLCLSCVATERTELEAQIEFALDHLHHTPEKRLDGKGGARIPACARDKVFYAPDPLRVQGKIAFVFPGSGNHFVNMGRDLARTWPDVFERQHHNNAYLRRQYRPEVFWNGKELNEIEEDHNSLIIAHVAMCTALSDRVRMFGVQPEMALGYSLGESSSLFSLGVWRERDEMLHRIEESPLFTRDLGGECAAARTLWRLKEDEAVDWCLGIVPMPREQIQPCISEVERAYLLIVNTPDECVIGGQRQAVTQVLERLGNPAFIELKGVTTVHCPVPEVVADTYHALHCFDTHSVDCDIFSCASGTSYTPGPRACADAILAQATDTIDFTRVINNAYAAGARIFIETGSGNSCTRMIPRILGDRPHLVRPTCVEGQSTLTTFSTLIAQLEAEGIRCDIEDLRLPGLPIQSEPPTPEHKAMVNLRNGISDILLPSDDFAKTDKNTSAANTPHAAYNILDKDYTTRTDVCICAADNNPPCNDKPDTYATQDTSGANAGESMADLASAALESMQQIQSRHSAAHAEFLRLSTELHTMMAENMRLQQGYAAEWNVDAVESFTPDSVLPRPQPPSNTPRPQPLPGAATPLYDRRACMEFAVGAIGNMLGKEFASIDSHPTRVRLPDEPLMLVDRIVHLEGEPCSMGSGRVITEHDVTSERWYLDGGHIPTCVAVEAGQADLFLSAYLGIDLQTKGKAMYRLLDAVVKFHSHLPRPGDIIRYDIRIERFFRQGDTWLFKFNFESTVNGTPLLSMRDGCAGFFTPNQLDDGRGVVHTELDRRPIQGTYSPDWRRLIPMDGVEQYSAAQIEALRQGDLAACFGSVFANLPLQQPYTLPGGHLELVDRVTHLDPHGGRYGIGQIKAEMDIDPQDWFLTCHFCDDNVMPGTLMYECCLHTLRVFLMRMGWVTEIGEGHWEPIPGVDSQLKCRGQVTEHTRSVTYEVNVKEIGYRPEPYAIVDALMYADSKAIVEITNMTIQLSGLSRDAMEKRWAHAATEPAQGAGAINSAEKKPPLFDYASILAFSNGKPSEAFGEPYRIFDSERRIARLPRPPFQFLDRITAVDATAWKMVAGGSAEAQYDVPPDAWYFVQERADNVPFSVLLEIALQPCGWLAAYVGSALTSEVDLCFRNLDGNAQKLRPVTRESGTLTTTVKLTRVSSSGGMIIQSYDFEVCDTQGPVYRGDTVFGFFSEQALANQVGIQGVKPYTPDAAELQHSVDSEPYPTQLPFPDEQLRMLDHIDAYIPDGGPHGLGFLRASKSVNPQEWFFEAHFYQDPVCPGSLGLESFIQLIKYAAVHRWGADESTTFEVTALDTKHHWSYRGQIIPSNHEIRVEALISGVDDDQRRITADGFLSVDGKTIYSMQDFSVNMTTKSR